MLPDVPSVAEAGVAGYESVGWFGVVAPAGTPAAIVTRLNAAFNAAVADEQVKAAMRNLGAEPLPGTPQAFQAFVASETQKLAKVIRTANIKPE
jgi:tripartite-type tricarboxylate transporter receptor subunit TctC